MRMAGKNSFDWAQIIAACIIGVLGLAGILYTFTRPPPDFSVTIDPIQGSAMQGDEIAAQITATSENGYSGSLHLNASHLPGNLWAGFNPQEVNLKDMATSIVTLRIGEPLEPSEYEIPIELTGSDGKTHTVTYFLRVQPVFYPTGWMGDDRDVTLVEKNTGAPHTPPSSLKITYTAAGLERNNWAGIYWQYPPGNWGTSPRGHDLSGKQVLQFWARGEKGGEVAEFKVGGIEGQYPDSLVPAVSTGKITLTDTWQPYTIDLKGKNLSHVIGGFVWASNRDDNPDGCTLYIDDIEYD